jgi:hypothetical protein
MDLKIVCPSMGRYDTVITKDLVNDLIIVCPEKEAGLYRDMNPECEIIPQPKDVVGITATRQFILSNFGNVFMIDDDVMSIRRQFVEAGEPYVIKDQQLIRDIIFQNAQTCKDMGGFMFGFSHIIRPVHYRPQTPFKFNGYLNASYCGFLKGHNLKYDIDLSEGEDHYMACYNVYKNRFMLIDKRYAFATKENFKSDGGCSSYRNSASLLDNTLKLRELFGEAVQLKKANNFKMDMREGERTLKLQF